MPSVSAMQPIARAVDQHLRPLGFRRHGLAFLLHDTNWGGIVLDPMPWSPAETIEFSVIVAVASEQLREFDHRELGLPKFATPRLGLFHIEQSLDWLAGGRGPGLFRVSRDAEQEEFRVLADHLVQQLDAFAIPWIHAAWRDEQIRDMWLGVPDSSLDEQDRERLDFLISRVGPGVPILRNKAHTAQQSRQPTQQEIDERTLEIRIRASKLIGDT